MTPYQTIWLNPKRTFTECVVNNKSQPLFALPIIIWGISLGLDMTPEVNGLFGDEFIWWILLITIPAGIGMSFFTIGLIMPGLTKLVGRLWHGKSTMRQMVNVYSISFLPLGLLLIYQLLLFSIGEDPMLDQVNDGLSYILWLWSYSLLIIGISKIQGFSYGIALLNLLLGFFPLFLIGIIRIS